MIFDGPFFAILEFSHSLYRSRFYNQCCLLRSPLAYFAVTLLVFLMALQLALFFLLMALQSLAVSKLFTLQTLMVLKLTLLFLLMTLLGTAITVVVRILRACCHRKSEH